VWQYGARNTTTGKSLDRTDWAIVDPETRAALVEATIQHPANSGDLGCAGHAWTRDGRLVVAGGTKWSFESPVVVGARHVYLFDPLRYQVGNPNNMWVKQDAELDRDRWYPSVYMIPPNPDVSPEPRLLIMGGDASFEQAGSFFAYPENTNTYESFTPPQLNFVQGAFEHHINRPTSQLFYGPAEGNSNFFKAFGFYPRAQLLADGRLFWAGFRYGAASFRHDRTQTETYVPVDDATPASTIAAMAAACSFPT
jgi:hypothetical protein